MIGVARSSEYVRRGCANGRCGKWKRHIAGHTSGNLSSVRAEVVTLVITIPLCANWMLRSIKYEILEVLSTPDGVVVVLYRLGLLEDVIGVVNCLAK